MGLLEPDDRELLVLRRWEGLAFDELGARLGIAADAARMRFNRAVVRLADKVKLLRAGRIEQAVEGGPAGGIG